MKLFIINIFLVVKSRSTTINCSKFSVPLSLVLIMSLSVTHEKKLVDDIHIYIVALRPLGRGGGCAGLSAQGQPTIAMEQCT